jgi:hypothetical protein
VTDPIEALDGWLRDEFVRINTELEEAYFAAGVDLIRGRADLDALKLDLLRQGGTLLERLAGMAVLPEDARARYRLLGMVGYYLAACQRHEAGLSDAAGGRQAAWCVAMRLAGSLGVVPRFVFAHQGLCNDAVGGRCRGFTSLPDDELFVRFNALGVLAYRRAAEALRGIAELGVSNPAAAYLLETAEAALDDVLRFNQELGRELDVNRFYFNVRPYFKSHPVGGVDYRGANAGDFAAINEVDVILGLCRTDDPFYQAILHEKSRHVPPEDQHALRALDRRTSLLESFCRELDARGDTAAWRANATLFLAVCRAHGAAYAYHHQRLVKPFLEEPAKRAGTAHPSGLTSSGPPLPEVIATLQRLLDLRTARDRTGIASAAPSIARLRRHLGVPA